MSYVTPRKVPYFSLEIKKAFEALTPKERLYAHYFNTASWHGFSACSQQLSAESSPLLKLFYRLFTSVVSSPNGAAGIVKSLQTITVDKGLLNAEEFQKFLEYFSLVYANSGNYLSFGDSKFIPACEKSAFQKIFDVAGVLKNFTTKEERQFSQLLDKIYSMTPDELTLSFKCTSYYSPDMTEEDVLRVNKWMTEQRMLPENTRVFKSVGKSTKEKPVYRICVASAEIREEPAISVEDVPFDIIISYGDYSEYMQRITENLTLAQSYAANDTQQEMLARYIQYFTSGYSEEHKKSQRLWVKDKNPVVETNMGFIETYKDPSGVRGEWEAFVAIVNKEQSSKYAEMVEKGEKFIAKLPWGADFEKEKFVKPDFTSLEVLGFVCSGPYAGICIPNYDDIRRDDGFKNVYLSNIVAAINFSEKINHLTDEDWNVYKELFLTVSSVSVGVHELLGHGTGKLFCQNEDGTFNFEKGKVVNPLTNKMVETFYKPGETFMSMFGSVSSPYEECRAEGVALFLGCEPELLSIFGIKQGMERGEDEGNVIHMIWLSMVRAGLASLEFYNPEKKQWLQAHMRARFAILQTLLMQESSIVKIRHETEEKGGAAVLEITIDKKRILSDGKKAIGNMLCHLNINRSICDVAAGTAFFEGLTEVKDSFLKIRETVMKVRKPRKQFVQPHTRLTADGKDAELLTFDGSVEGMVEAFVSRHRDIPL